MPAEEIDGTVASARSTSVRLFMLIASFDRGADTIRGGAGVVLAATVTQEPLVVGLISAASFLPWVVLGPLAGVYLDRWSVIRTYRLCTFMRALVACAAAILFMWGHLTAWSLGATMLALTAFQVFANTAQNSLLAELVPDEELPTVNGSLSALQSTAGVIGNPIGTYLASLFAWVPMLAVSVLCFIQAGLLRMLPGSPIAHPRPTANRGVVKDIKAGLATIRESQKLRLLMSTVFVMNVASGAVMATLPIIALHQLAMNPALLGLSYALQGVAMVGGNLIAKRLTAKRLPALWVMGAAILLQVPGFLGFAGAASFIGVFVGQSLIGLGAGLWNVPSSSALIIAAKGPTRSRTLASYKTIAVMGPPLGAVAGGALASVMGTGWALLAVAVVSVLNFVVFAVRGARLAWYQPRGGTS